VGTRPDQGSTDEMAARLKKAFNTSSLGLDNGGNTVQDSTQDLKKAQHTADLIEKTEVQAMLRDIGASEGISIALGSKNRKLEIKEKIEKQRWQRFLGHLLVQRSIEEAIERAREIIGFHQSQMDILAELIKEGREKLTELFEHKQALKQQIDHFRETGRFDLDENGRFRNSRAEEALAAWEEKTNSHIDLHSPSSYLSVLEAASDIEAQEAETKQGVERDEEDYRYHKTKRDEAIEIKDDLKSGDPVRCQQALERLENIEGRESITTARNLVSNKTRGFKAVGTH
jgi:phage host-nuclease inhibitor protein Gam